MTKQNLIGKKFGRLTVVNRILNKWQCICDCGKEHEVITSKLNSGHTKSCGCLNSEKARNRRLTHGASKSLTYKRWQTMKRRCNKKNGESFNRYSARGIVICKKWLDSFEEFLSDMGECPSKEFTIERIDNNGNYEPENCKWATRVEQNKNTSRTNFIEYKGEKLCITDWALKLKIARSTLSMWVNNGLTMEEVISKSNSIKSARNIK